MTCLLCSFVPHETIDFYSEVGQKTVKVAERLCSGSLVEIKILSKNYSDTAITAKLVFELFSYARSYVDTNEYTPYSLFYRIDFFLNNNTHYRGAFLDVNDYKNPAFLKSFLVDSTIYGADASGILSTNNLDGIGVSGLYSLFVNPTETTDYFLNNKEYNDMDSAQNSYKYPIEKDYMPSHWERLDAYNNTKLEHKPNKETSTIVYSKSIIYPTEFTAGPNSTACPSYYFSVFDSIGFTSKTRPTQVFLKLSVNGMYGQNTWRAYFYDSSSTSNTFSIN